MWLCRNCSGSSVAAPTRGCLFGVGVLVNVGMWFERFVIVVSSLSADYLPSSWGYYSPTWVDVLTLAGSFGLFFTCFLLFCRYLPMMAMAEVKPLLAHVKREPCRWQPA